MFGIDRLRRRLPTKVAALLVAVPVIGAASMAVAGQIASPSSVQVTNLLKTRLPKTPLTQVNCEKVHGLCEVTAGANLFYVDAGARYLIIGRVYDMETRQDLTAARLLEINPDMLVGGAAKANAAAAEGGGEPEGAMPAAKGRVEKTSLPARPAVLSLDSLPKDGAIVCPRAPTPRRPAPGSSSTRSPTSAGRASSRSRSGPRRSGRATVPTPTIRHRRSVPAPTHYRASGSR